MVGTGGASDRVVVRGIGPSLASVVSNALANPTLELRNNNGSLLVSNNDWQDNPVQAAEITAAGLAPANSLEAAIMAILPPGRYTALLFGANNGTGNGLVEVYDLGPTPAVTHQSISFPRPAASLPTAKRPSDGTREGRLPNRPFCFYSYFGESTEDRIHSENSVNRRLELFRHSRDRGSPSPLALCPSAFAP